jgi:uncharacterized membrane protein HdeD (DUF308 family)
MIVTRPLTSLVVLGLYIGISCVMSGTADVLGRRFAAPWYDLALAVLWIVAGLAILSWLGRSIELLPTFLAILLIVSGLGRFTTLLRGVTSERALAASFGVAEMSFGAFAVAWPDVTLIVVAVLFGARTIVFGLSLLWRAARSSAPAATVAPTAQPTNGRTLIAAARWTAAVAVLALAAGTLLASRALRSGLPVLDAFYSPPSALPAQPGVLLRSEPYAGALPSGVSAWRILYTTTLRDGVPGLASGVVAVPRSTSTEPRPVIAWAHGTVGVSRACAPSLTSGAISSAAVPALDAVVRNGWGLVATDYPGMGTAGDMPYLVGEGAAIGFHQREHSGNGGRSDRSHRQIRFGLTIPETLPAIDGGVLAF